MYNLNDVEQGTAILTLIETNNKSRTSESCNGCIGVENEECDKLFELFDPKTYEKSKYTYGGCNGSWNPCLSTVHHSGKKLVYIAIASPKYNGVCPHCTQQI